MPEQDFQARFMVTIQGYGWPEREKPKVKATLEEILELAFGSNAQVSIARAAPQRASNGHDPEPLGPTVTEVAAKVRPPKKGETCPPKKKTRVATKSTPPSPKSTKRSKTNRPSSGA